MTRTQVHRGIQALCEKLGCEMVPAEERGYYRLWWPKHYECDRTSSKPVSILCTLLFLATCPAHLKGLGMTIGDAGKLAGVTSMPSTNNLAGWEELLLRAALPAEVREAMTRIARKEARRPTT